MEPKAELSSTGAGDGTVAETDWLVFRKSPIHGIGAFARRDIPKGARVIEYVGEKIDKQESLRRCERDNQYIFALNADQDIDGSMEWNLARYINHSCAPNCDAEPREGGIWILANRAIQAGEEVLINYNYDLEDYRSHPCHCGAPNCAGFIVAEEFFDHVRRAMTGGEAPG